MKRSLTTLIVCSFFAAAACSSNGGGDVGSDAGHTTANPGRIAGGQSGNDGSGSYSCDVTDAALSDTPVDSTPMHANCSPAEAASRLSWATTTRLHDSPIADHSVVFDCASFGRYVVEVGPATAAQLLTGRQRSDTSEEPGTSGGPCVAFVVDSAIRVTSLDGGAPFEATKLDADHICWQASFSAQRADGATMSGAGEIATGPLFDLTIEFGTTTVVCGRTRTLYPPLPMQPHHRPHTGGAGMGGEGGGSDVTNGGAGGEGGGSDATNGGVGSSGEGGAAHER